jgi:hypothetical protein
MPNRPFSQFDPEVTEGFNQDYNKRKIIDRKDEASYAIGLAEAMPTIDFARAAYGKLNTFASLLTHDNIPENEKFLTEKRMILRDLGRLVNGSPTSTQLTSLQHKYKIYPTMTKKGVASERQVVWTNLNLFVEKLRDICTDLTEYAQGSGFGSSKAIPKKKGVSSALEMSELEPEDVGL